MSLEKSAILLDRFHIPTRYPNGLPDLTPEDSYLEEDAQSGLENASKIVSVHPEIGKFGSDQGA